MNFPNIPPMPKHVLAAAEAQFAQSYPRPGDFNQEFADACKACDYAMNVGSVYSWDYECFTQYGAWNAHRKHYMYQIKQNWEWQQWRDLFHVNESILDALADCAMHMGATNPAGYKAWRKAEEICKQWGKL